MRCLQRLSAPDVGLGVATLLVGLACSGKTTRDEPSAGRAGMAEAGYAGQPSGAGGSIGTAGGHVGSGGSAADAGQPSALGGSAGTAGAESVGGQHDGGSSSSPCETEREAVVEFVNASKACTLAADCASYTAGCGISDHDCTGTVFLNRRTSHAELAARMDELQACLEDLCKTCDLPSSLWACRAGKCERQEPGAVCIPGVDPSCNDSPFVSSIWGRCLDSGTCECNPGYETNPETGRCRPAQ
ncbi:MAG TPA: hypothetical protein VIM73_17310 [Polyangiaceae bacterium]